MYISNHHEFVLALLRAAMDKDDSKAIPSIASEAANENGRKLNGLDGGRESRTEDVRVRSESEEKSDRRLLGIWFSKKPANRAKETVKDERTQTSAKRISLTCPIWRAEI